MDRAGDEEIRRYAHANDYIIVTNDADFSDLAALHGFPPKVVWLRLGNATTDQVERTLRNGAPAIRALVGDPSAGVLVVTEARPS